VSKVAILLTIFDHLLKIHYNSNILILILMWRLRYICTFCDFICT